LKQLHERGIAVSEQLRRKMGHGVHQHRARQIRIAVVANEVHHHDFAKRPNHHHRSMQMFSLDDCC
jgi:hypothetical protein